MSYMSYVSMTYVIDKPEINSERTEISVSILQPSPVEQEPCIKPI